MDTTEKKEIANPIPQEEVGEATTEISSPSKNSEVDEKAKETTDKQGEEEHQEKENTDKDAGDDDVRLEAEVMEGKKRHLIKEATLFPRILIMFGFRMVAGNSDMKLSRNEVCNLACVMFPLAVLLLVSGNWLNSGEFGMEAVHSKPWPNEKVEEHEEQQNILHSGALIGWILGFFMLLNFVYNVWTSFALWTLIFDKFPWARERWNQARVATDEFMGKVREESLLDQYHRMTKAQMESMAKHDGERRLLRRLKEDILRRLKENVAETA